MTNATTYSLSALATATLAAALLGGCPTNAPSGAPATVHELAGQRFIVQEVARHLEVPWALGFSPDGDLIFVTERPGRLRALDADSGAIVATLRIANVAPPLPRSEQGLMGLAVSPDFANDQTVYVSYTAPTGQLDFVKNVIARFRLAGDTFEPVDAAPLLDGLPAAFIHDGLPLGFGPDGKLYASTGDATRADAAQDPATLNGKYLRLNPDGSIPSDNPFGATYVYTLGHRNSQGFDWHPTDPSILLATEHGPSFPIDGVGGQDEINRLVAGANYGWPLVRGAQSGPDFKAPLYQTGSDTIAPGGGAFCSGLRYPAWENAFLFAGLADASLWLLQLDPGNPDTVASLEQALVGEFGRLRAVAEGPDGYIYLTTSNRDSRGTPAAGDDRILCLVPLD